MEARTVPEKVTVAYRGAKYEIGRGKRCYGIWVTGAPASDPIDRWPQTSDGWTQAWTRFTAIETPGTITKLESSRAGLKLPRPKRTGARSTSATAAVARRTKPSRATVAAGLVGLGVLLGLIGLFPGYVGSQSLASQADQLWPHLLYLATWTASAVLIALGAAGARRAPWPETSRLGALLGTGLSAVTFGLFFADLGEVLSGQASLGAGLIVSLLGWLACTAGSVLPLTARTRASAPSPAAQSPAMPAPAGPAPVAPASPHAGQSPAGPYLAGPTFGAPPQGRAGYAAPAGALGALGPARPRLANVGPLALVLLAAIGAVAAFVPSWDSYTLTASAEGTAQTITAGNAFANPGVVIAGDVAVMIAVIAVAVLAGLWRPVRHGAVLLAGATVPLIAQAISALIQVSEPATAAQFGISQAQASAAGLSITSGVTPIFWVYCVFVISLVVSCAWMLTAPHHPAMPSAPRSPGPAPMPPSQDVDDEADDSDDDAQDDAESTYA